MGFEQILGGELESSLIGISKIGSQLKGKRLLSEVHLATLLNRFKIKPRGETKERNLSKVQISYNCSNYYKQFMSGNLPASEQEKAGKNPHPGNKKRF